MSAPLKPLDNRLFWPVVAAGGLLILAFVLCLQHVRGFAPRSLRIFIRLDVLGLALTGIIGSLAPRSRTADGIAVLGMLAASPGGTYCAWPLVAEKKLTTQGMGNYKMFMGFPEQISLDTRPPQASQSEGLRGGVVWILLGQPMAVWPLALLVFHLSVPATKLVFSHRTA